MRRGSRSILRSWESRNRGSTVLVFVGVIGMARINTRDSEHMKL